LSTGKIKEQDARNSETGSPTFRRAWIPNQQGKECSHTKQGSRVSWIQDQHTDHANIVTSNQGIEVDAATSEASREESLKIVQMDSWITRENHSSNTSGGGGSTPYQAYPKRSGKELTNQPSSMRQVVYPLPEVVSGDTVVEDAPTSEE
jgi:hypothetical protein